MVGKVVARDVAGDNIMTWRDLRRVSKLDQDDKPAVIFSEPEWNEYGPGDK